MNEHSAQRSDIHEYAMMTRFRDSARVCFSVVSACGQDRDEAMNGRSSPRKAPPLSIQLNAKAMAAYYTEDAKIFLETKER